MSKSKPKVPSYPTDQIMEIDLTAIDEKTTKMSITAETPVTTITAMADYGRTNERINVFIATIGKIMESS